MADFLIENFWYIVLFVWLVGTALLMKTKFQRFTVLFLMRTHHGIRFLDRLARLSPEGWKAVADLSVIISFGGLGATYVARHRNPVPFLITIGVVALIFLFPQVGPFVTGALFVLLLVGSWIVHRWKHLAGSFILGTLVMAGMVMGLMGFELPGIIVGIITGVVGIPGLLVSFLGVQALQIVTAQSSVPGVSPLLPGISQSGELGFIFPGLDIFIPLWSGLIAIIILLVSHEFCHGILARVHKVKVQSMGLLTVGILPVGAFVEPDEKQIEKKKTQEKMRVYSMGSFANLIIAVLAAVLVVGVSLQAAGMVDGVGVEITSVTEGLPAEVLEVGTVITAINGVPVSTVEEYIAEASTYSSGAVLTLETDRGTLTLESVAPPTGEDRAYLGFNLQTKTELKEAHAGQEFLLSALLFIITTLNIIFLFNLNIAFVNLLPVLPFDGYKMFEELLKSFRIRPKRRKHIEQLIVFLIVFLLLLNALPLGGLAAGALGI